jgi:ATP-dependent DNA helicase RecG
MASLRQVQNWVALGESETQEFKQTTGQRSDAAKTLCAMLNKSGGRVLFGVSPAGKIAGQQVSDKTLEDITFEVQQIEPPAFPEIERLRLDSGNEMIVLGVAQGTRRPYTYRGKGYKRVGSSTLEMTRHEYNQMLMEQLHATQRWENQVADGWAVADLDTTEIVRTLEEAIRRGRTEDPGTRDPAEILRGLGLLSRTGHLLRAAVVLFAQAERLLPDYPQCVLRVARFRGVDKSEFLDNRRFEGNAFDLLRRAERFLIENLPVAGRIVPNLFERIDDPLYPTKALREALANAFCHRDYATSGSVGVAVFDDRLEVASSGELHFGLTAADLFGPHESRPWNPLIANVFYRRGIIESWGRGTLKMMELLEQAGLPKLEIEEIPGAVLVRFRPSRYVAPQRIQHDLTAHQRAILEVLANHEPMLPKDVHQLTGAIFPLRRTRDDLARLKEWGLVAQVGFGRGSRWMLKGPER